MKVSDLISLLEECDPEAEVRLMTQQNYPFEHRVLGIATRAEMDDSDICECNHRVGQPHDEVCAAFEQEDYDDGLTGNDVFIVEGGQERNGNRHGWRCAAPEFALEGCSTRRGERAAPEGIHSDGAANSPVPDAGRPYPFNQTW